MCLREPEPGAIRLEVVDHGQGLPPGFDIAQPTGSLGKRLISGFSRQLGATVKVLDAHPGARFIVDIPRASGEAAPTLN